MMGAIMAYDNAGKMRFSNEIGYNIEKLTDDHQQGSAGEERTPRNLPGSVLDVVDRSRSAAQDKELNIIDHERDDLEEASGGCGESLKDDITTERQLRSMNRRAHVR
jgi:hypothetical protein